MKPIALDIASARKALSLGRTKIYGLVKTGDLTAVKIGRKTLITVASIVNRRANGTPYRRAKGTPFHDGARLIGHAPFALRAA